MGNSESQAIATPNIPVCAPMPKPAPAQQPLSQLVQNVEQTIENEQPQTQQLVPEKLKKLQHKKLDLSTAIHKAKRELPPLKKVRSSKKMEEIYLLQKQNMASACNADEVKERKIKGEEEEHSRRDGEQVIFQLKDWDDEETLKNTESSFRETRTKKLRLSKKAQNVPSAYF